MPPLPEPLWKAASPELQAAVLALVQSYEERLAQLENRLSDLENRLKLNSTNSSKPPSSDPIGMKRRPPAPPSKKKRGGQPGHRKARRVLGTAREGPRDVRVQAGRLSPLWSWTRRRRPRAGDPSGRRTAQDRADRRRVSAPSPDLSRLSRDDLRRVAGGRPHRVLRPVPPGRAGDVRGGLSPQQAADPPGRRRPVHALDLHRDDLQAGAAVGRRPRSPLQRTRGRGPPRRGDEHRRDVVAGAAPQGLVVGDGHPPLHGLHHRQEPQRRCRPGALGERRRSGRRQRPVQCV